MPRHLHLDYETFSLADLKDVGAFRYIQDESAEILCAAMALDDGEPVAWWQGMPDSELAKLDIYWDALEDPSVLIYAHNAMFEIAVSLSLMEKTWGIKCPDLSRFRCTMSLARRACLPGSLEKLGETLGLSAKKDNRGKALIKKFSVMQAAKKPTKKNPDGLPPRRIFPKDEPEAFMEFVEYCRQDVRVEQEVLRKLAYFDDDLNNRDFTSYAKINARGVTLNISALQNAQRIIDKETAIVSERFRELVGFEITQRDRILEWVNANGYRFEDLQAETIENFLAGESKKAGEPGIVDQALRMKQAVSYAAPKKVATMLACVGPHDNRARGMLNHHGATTGRGTSSLIQLQNAKRSSGASVEAYGDICKGISREWLNLFYGDPLEIISLCIRHFVQDGDRMLNDADYSGIEARIVCWLAGQEDALQRFRKYDAAPKGSVEKKNLDPYRVMAADVYRKPVAEIVPFPERFVGKGLVLGAGFKLSADGFKRQCLDQAGYDISDADAEKAIGLWRKKHDKVVKWWDALDKASKNALISKGEVFKAGKVSFCCKDIEGIEYLLMKLPSGRKLSYPRPRIVPGKWEGSTQIEYFGNIKGAMWGSCRLWPGALANNATQAVAADVMQNGTYNCEREDYQIMTVIHDQAIASHQDGQTSEEFVRLLTDLPAWADGLPIAAEGSLVPYYTKE